MGTISAETHKFHRGTAPEDGNCLYWSILDVCNWALIHEFNEDLRIRVANCIRQHKNLHDIAFNTIDKCEDIEVYCKSIEQGELWGGQAELAALSILLEKLIIVIYVTELNGQKKVWPVFYGEDNPSTTECIYIIYENKHYEPLYIMNMNHPNQRETIFDRKSVIVQELLRKFVREDLKCNDDVKLGAITPITVQEVSNPMDDPNEIDVSSTVMLPRSSVKRKTRDIDNVLSVPNDDKQMPISIPKTYYDSNKRIKASEGARDTISTFQNNTESDEIDKLLQTDFFIDETGLQNNQQGQVNLENGSITQSDNRNDSNCNDQ